MSLSNFMVEPLQIDEIEINENWCIKDCQVFSHRFRNDKLWDKKIWHVLECVEMVGLSQVVCGLDLVEFMEGGYIYRLWIKDPLVQLCGTIICYEPITQIAQKLQIKYSMTW